MKTDKKRLYKSIRKADRTIRANQAVCDCVSICITGAAAFERALNRTQAVNS